MRLLDCYCHVVMAAEDMKLEVEAYRSLLGFFFMPWI